MLYPWHPGYSFNGTFSTSYQVFGVYIAIGDTSNEKDLECNNVDEESGDNIVQQKKEMVVASVRLMKVVMAMI